MSAAALPRERSELEVRGLSKEFAVGGGLFARERVHAVDDVTFTLKPGRVTALVGESGSGKSTVAKLLLRLYDPTSGSVLIDGRDIAGEHSRKNILHYRTRVQMIFQDPFDSLNPVKTIHHHLARPLAIHKIVPRKQIDARVHELLDTVGLVPPEKFAAKYPHELSGGQRQRVSIARALAVEPTVLIADEPTSMLDVSIRIGILNLIVELKEQHGLAFLYVTHDLASARYVADDVLVMYAGQIVEQGPIDDILAEPAASVHAAAALGRSRSESRRRGARRAQLRPAVGRDRPDCRLPFPLALPACDRRLLSRHAGARRAGPGPRRPLSRHRTVLITREELNVRPAQALRSHPTLSGAPRRRRTRSRAQSTRTAAARASGTVSARRPARSGTATAAQSRATSTTATATTSA